MTTFPATDPTLEALVRRIGEQLFARMDTHPAPTLLSRKGAHTRLMDWVMQDPALKTQVFRFVDVLPALDSSADLVEHLREYLGDQAVELNPALKAGLNAASLAPALLAAPVRAEVADMAAQFVAGQSVHDLVRRASANADRRLATTVDLLGESVLSEAEADAFLTRNLEALDAMAAVLAEPSRAEAGEAPANGRFRSLSLSVKISALAADANPADPEHTTERLKSRLRTLLRRAREVDAQVTFDMESYRLKDLTLSLFKAMLEEPEFRSGPEAGIALQAYLRDCESDLRALVDWAGRCGRHVNVRLVKGAYWDSETILARQRGWPVPVWQRKAETDANFEKLTVVLLERIDRVTPFFASHNVRSCAHAIAQAERLGVDSRAYEFQALYGMADELKLALAGMGHRVREYCPVGELLPGMAYFVRRLLENTSNEGFLRLTHTGRTPREQLLDNPCARLAADTAGSAETESGTRHTMTEPVESTPFRNAAHTDFTVAANRARQREALDTMAASRPGGVAPLVIGGTRIADRELVSSVNPARPAQIVGRWARATVEDAEAAVAASVAYAPAWRATPADERARMLERAADLMDARRFALNALIVFEAAKPWAEADADVAEAIDFCRFYAREMRRLAEPAVTQRVPGEDCVQVWDPRGVGVAIAPWNFPIAILTGLTVAPLVAGNCVIVKPSNQTTLVGAELVSMLMEAGVPGGALQFVPGPGGEIGGHLVAHPEIDFIAFTGSRAVGCDIWEQAGKTRPGQRNLKKVVCEMGGKNALIIDADADLDEAIPAAIRSAFGYAGQKCSALSRLIVLDGIYDHFLERFLGACATIRIGDPADPATLVGPVIDGAAQQSILRYVDRGTREARLAWQGVVPPGLADSGGFYVPPTVFVDCRPEHVIVREEIFGPVLAVLRARDLDDAFALANRADYALTGGIFSRSPHAIERARHEFLVGNLYINRGITGAIVERHPFGGFRMSGAGTKAGGTDYLKNFLFPRVIAENVMRRGFAPPTDR